MCALPAAAANCLVNLGDSYNYTVTASAVSAAFDANGFLHTALGEVEVNFDGIPAPLVYVSGARIEAMVPLELLVGAATLRLKAKGVALPDYAMCAARAISAVFENASGYAEALNQDGTVNSASNPARIGSLGSIRATGAGWNAPGLDGQRAATAPGVMAGVVQINFQVNGSYNGLNAYRLAANGQSEATFFSIYATP